jgi:hypothetical protein
VQYVLSGHWRVVSAQVERPERPSSPLLIRGFGVRVPGGAPVLTWAISHVYQVDLTIERAGRDSSGEVGLGDAVGMASRPLDQLDPVAVRVGDPTGPRPVRAGGHFGRLGYDPLRGKIGEGRVQRLDLDDEVVDAGAEVDGALAGS